MRHDWVAPIVLLLLSCALAFATTVTSSGSLSIGPSPILLYGLAAYIALRHRHSGWVSPLFVPATVFFVMWFASEASGVFLPFVIGLSAAYLLDPLVDKLEPRVGRDRAIAVLAIPTLLALAALALLLIPSLFAELSQLAGRAPELRENLQQGYDALLGRAADAGLSFDRDAITEFFSARINSIAAAATGAGVGLWHGVRGIIDLLSFLVITPVIGFYLLRDFDRMRDSLLDTLPQENRAGAVDFLERLDHSVSGYLRGQILVGLFVGGVFYGGLTILKIDYALLVGISAVVLNLIPFVGSVMTAALALSVAQLTSPGLTSLLQVGGLYAVVQLLDAAVISPRVMGKSMDLHPVVVMLSLLVAGQFFGLIGMLLAVPAAALLKESVRRWTPEFLALLPTLEASDQNESPG